MKNSLYIYQNGELSRKDNTIRFTSIDGTKRDMPINSISEIYFFGENTFNTKLITFLAQNNIIAHFLITIVFMWRAWCLRKIKWQGNYWYSRLNII